MYCELKKYHVHALNHISPSRLSKQEIERWEGAKSIGREKHCYLMNEKCVRE